MRDFVEERRFERVQEELRRLIPPEIAAIYRQNPVLNKIWTATGKEMVEYRRRFLAEQEAAGNILPSKKHADRA